MSFSKFLAGFFGFFLFTRLLHWVGVRLFPFFLTSP